MFPPPETSPRVAVVGTLNLDQVVRLRRFPDVGETVMGADIVERSGGKGANQAVAAAAICPTFLIGAVGDDDAGRRMMEDRRGAGVDVTHVGTVDASSGRAMIEVDDHGDNRIVVIAGANARLTGDVVRDALDRVDADVVLTQLESPIDVTQACARWCREHSRRLVLNPSPVAPLDQTLLATADPLVVNESEAEFYASVIDTPRSVVTTLGAREVVVRGGAFGGGTAAPQHIPVRSVEVADTVGAGDCFAGTLAALLADGVDLVAAARRATDAATDHVAAH